MAETLTRGNRGLLVGGAVLLWILGLMWALHSKGLITTSRSDTASPVTGDSVDEPAKTSPDTNLDGNAVTELVIALGASSLA